ncbi:NUDIX hydrolase [Sphaerisporangium krabiense]|nr:NUDIX hydrolase [Sphaerisporangium krabiense]
MNFDDPLYERDPDAWNSYLAAGNATQPRKRVSVDVLLRDDVGRILLVDPKYKPDWDLPGGMAEANEAPTDTARRELCEELGCSIEVGPLLCIDWQSPHGPWDDLLAFVFDGGTLSSRDIDALHLADEELAAYEFCSIEQTRQRLRPYMFRRLTSALEALVTGQCRYLQDGHQQLGK